MRILILSDTHSKIESIFRSWSKEDQSRALECDLMIHGGDISSHGTLPQIESELSWMDKNLPMEKVIIAGNHDFYLDTDWRSYTTQGRNRFSSKIFGTDSDVENLMTRYNMIYLNDSFYIKDGIKIWGSPVTPWFHDWAFNRQRGGDIQKNWDLIPNDTDILVTHGPPRGILDLIDMFYMRAGENPHVGCDHLLSKVQEVIPKLHIFGHIHESRGTVTGGTVFINASSLDIDYQPVNKPIIYDYK